MKINKKLLVGIIILIVAVICAVAIYGIYGNMAGAKGVYYSQQDDGKYINFSKDGSFSYAYNPDNDKKNPDAKENENIQAYIIKSGTWSVNNGKTVVKTKDSEEETVFLKHNGYLYIEGSVFRGIQNNDKLLKNKYLKEISEEQYEELWFFEDGTMSYVEFWGGSETSRPGTYTKDGDIITVRFKDTPDAAHRYMMLPNGVSKGIYSSKLPK